MLIKGKILIILYSVALMVSMPVLADYTNGVNGVDFAKRPSIDAEIMSSLPYRTEVEIIRESVGKDGEWAKVKHEDIVGYVHGSCVQEKDPVTDLEYLGEWHITAYTHTGNVCANGNYPTAWYTVACNSLDLGTQIYIEGIGVRTVEDRGPGWLGSEWCDIFMDSYDECVVWGSQHKNVYIIEKGN